MRIRLAELLAVIICCSWLALPGFAQDPPQPAPEPAAAEPQPAPAQEEDQVTRPGRQQGDIVNFGDNAYLGKDDSAETLVAIGGTATSEGAINDSVVAVFGNTHVTGSVAENAVAVFGDLYVDGTVGSEAVAVMGDVTIGPNAVIDGDVTSVGGSVTVDPAAVIRGTIEQVSADPLRSMAEQFVPWFKDGLLLGRPLAFEPGFGWAWRIALLFLALYVVIALVFPKQLTDCAQTLERAPGESLLAGLLTVLLLPLAGLTLLMSVIAIPLLPFLWIGLFVGTLFGKAAVLAALGRRLTGFLDPGPFNHVAVAVLIGGAIVLGIYAIPVLGFIGFMLLRLVGLGVFMYWLLLKIRARQGRRRAEQPARRVDLSKATDSPGAVDSRAADDPSAATAPPPTESSPADGASSAMLALPRAGFWIRMAALLVDVLVVAVVVGMVSNEDMFPWAIAGYGALMWKLKGTTIGGTLCNLQVVRLDGRELDWPTAIVRALSCYLSLIIAGLGFLWIAFDEQRQGWHDKIAGTVVVRTVRTVALV
jgi:uncharacterized RDD family membrane protein YckC/cytoskeletal protein CcmA (bactofilin family)